MKLKKVYGKGKKSYVMRKQKLSTSWATGGMEYWECTYAELLIPFQVRMYNWLRLKSFNHLYWIRIGQVDIQ